MAMLRKRGEPAGGDTIGGVCAHADHDVPDLPVDPLEVLMRRRSAKWRTYPADVLPLTVAEMDFALAAPVAAALHEAVDRSDTGYAMAVPELGQAVAGFAGRRWSWDLGPPR